MAWVAWVAVVAAAGVVAACGGGDDRVAGPSAADGVRIASFDFPESALLAEMYAQLVESTGIPVVRLGEVGPREVVAPALEAGQIDLVPEYLGTALWRFGRMESSGDADEMLEALDRALEPRGLTALRAARAQDKNVFAVSREFADREGLETISDLAPLAESLRFGGPPECADRALCLVGLRQVYGLEFAEFVPQPSLDFTAEALERNEIDVGLMFSTSSALVTFGLVILDDDRELQPVENVVPVIRIDALDRWGPGITEALGRLAEPLTTRGLRALNVRVDREESIETVAREWLTSERLLD